MGQRQWQGYGRQMVMLQVKRHWSKAKKGASLEKKIWEAEEQTMGSSSEPPTLPAPLLVDVLTFLCLAFAQANIKKSTCGKKNSNNTEQK